MLHIDFPHRMCTDLRSGLTPWRDTGVVILELLCEIPLIPYMTFFSVSLSSVLTHSHATVRTCCVKWLTKAGGEMWVTGEGTGSVHLGPLDALWGKQ